MAKIHKDNKAICEKVCDIIATSKDGVLKACRANKISTDTFYQWVNETPENAKRYTRAREEQADFMGQEILDIADETSNDTIDHEKFGEMPNNEWINRSRLRVDARKWLMSKLAPKKYGDKVDVTSDGDKISPVTPEMLSLIAAKINQNSH